MRVSKRCVVRLALVRGRKVRKRCVVRLASVRGRKRCDSLEGKDAMRYVSRKRCDTLEEGAIVK